VGPRLDVDPITFEAASMAVGTEIAGRVERTAVGLLDGLVGSAAMAGSDAAGQAWAGGYDDAATMTLGATQDVANGCYRLAALLQQTGFNYSRADASSTSGAADRIIDITAYASCSVQLGTPPRAHGGSAPPPNGWWLIEHAVGYIWPGGHQDRLRAAAAAWAAAAASLGDATLCVQDALECIAAQATPEVDDAMAACQAMDRHLWDLIAGYRSLAGTCSAFAGYLDEAHSDVEHELADLAAWSAAIQGLGFLAGTLTAGVGEVGAQGVQAGRIAAAAARVGGIIARLVELARGLAETISAVSARAVEISRNLRVLLSARLSAVTTEAVEALPAVRSAEAAAVRGLTSAEEASARVDRVLSRLRAGRRAPNLEVDTPAEVKQIWLELAERGTPIKPGFPGERIELPDGTEVGYRTYSKSGGPTIEIVRNGLTIKVHLR
jgi:hypothetical protein